MFGREARLLVDVCFGTERPETVSHSRYVEELKKDLQSAYELAPKSANQVHLSNKRNYEKVLRHQVLAKGDRVLLKNLGLKGKHKSQSRWNSFVVVDKLPDLPVYRVKPENGMGRLGTIHRDHILTIGSLARVVDDRDNPESVKGPVTRAHRKSPVTRIAKPQVSHMVEEETSDSECGIEHVYRGRTEYEGSGSHVLDRNAVLELSADDTADEQDSVAEYKECDNDPDVMSEAESVIDGESDEEGNIDHNAETPVEQRGDTVSERNSFADEDVQPQKCSPRCGKRSI